METGDESIRSTLWQYEPQNGSFWGLRYEHYQNPKSWGGANTREDLGSI